MNQERWYKLLRYLVSGGSAAVVTIGSLYLFKSVFHVWYLTSSIIGYGLGFFVSFTLQKFWTFSHKSLDNIHHEVLLFLSIGLINLGINTFFMYLFVDIAHVHYILSEILVAGLIAVLSFPIYGKIIFKREQL